MVESGPLLSNGENTVRRAGRRRKLRLSALCGPDPQQLCNSRRGARFALEPRVQESG
jgi:hypothetical protein